MADLTVMCNNCGCWREEHYLRDGSWNNELGCSEYQGRTASAEELKKRESELAKYSAWLSSRRTVGAAAAAPAWRK